jgi:myosin heavy subunit
MKHTNEPVPGEEQPVKKSQLNNKNLLIGILGAAVLALGGYLVYDQSKPGQTLQQKETALSTVTAEKSDVQSSFDASLSRLDSMVGVNAGLSAELDEKNAEIAKTKEEIRTILNKQDATKEELAKARSLIKKLNGTISDLREEVARLKTDNEKLYQDLTASNTARVELEKKVDVGSTLNASNIVITPMDVRRNGKEKVSERAKRVDKLLVSFDVANRIVQSGTTDLYVIVLGPDGQKVEAEPASGGMFMAREEGEKPYSAKVPVELETAKKQKVSFSFAPVKFVKGNYTVQIYQNGFLIGEGVRPLKKAGLFG